jgi:hypothetical protein
MLDIREIPEEILFLAARNPVVYAALTLYSEGRLSFDEAMIRIVQVLAQQNNSLCSKVFGLLSEQHPRSRYTDEPHTRNLVQDVRSASPNLSLSSSDLDR